MEIEIARLPSGTVIHMQVHVFHSGRPGPVVLLSGGLHGDEINGVEIVRRLVSDGHIDHLVAGSIVAIPIINVYGFINFSREVPDGKDVNRSFPGSPEGSLAALVAHTITDKIIPHIDFGIDFHTGGASRWNYPQIRYDPKSVQAKELAQVFNAPIYFPSAVIDGSLRATAAELKKVILVYEGGESMRFDEFCIDEAIKGAVRVLSKQGMLRNVPSEELKPSIALKNNNWIRAEASGLFKPLAKGGDHVEKNQKIGEINSPYGEYRKEVLAEYEGILISHNNQPLIHRGDALFHLGELK